MAHPKDHPLSAESQVTNTPELLGSVFIHLTIFDLLHVEQVCRRWRDCVRDVHELQPALYKRALPVIPRANPHFTPLDEANANMIYEGLPFEEQMTKLGHELVEGVRELMEEEGVEEGRIFAHRMGSGYGDPMTGYEIAQWNFNPGRLRDFAIHHGVELRRKELRSVYCRKCVTFHFGFEWQNLHPLLRFLKHQPHLCIIGHDSVLQVQLVHSLFDYSNRNDGYRIFDQAMELAENPERVDSICKRSHLAQDIGVQPLGQVLSVTFRIHYQRKLWTTSRVSGLTMSDFLGSLMLCTRALAMRARQYTDRWMVGYRGGWITDPEVIRALADAEVQLKAMDDYFAAMDARSALWREQTTFAERSSTHPNAPSGVVVTEPTGPRLIMQRTWQAASFAQAVTLG